MTQLISRKELKNALDALFGSDAEITLAQLGELRSDRLNAAFRRRAFSLHPDRALSLGVSEKMLGAHFHKVQEAFQLLGRYIDNPSNFVLQNAGEPPKKPVPRQSRRSGRSEAAKEWYNGNLPQRKMRLVEYLKETKRISWLAQSLALKWQRDGRPKVGQIAIDLGYLTTDQVLEIMRRRGNEKKWKHPFVDFALELGYITGLEQLAILGKQSKLQQPIGQYFVERQILKPHELEKVLAELRRHNSHQAA